MREGIAAASMPSEVDPGKSLLSTAAALLVALVLPGMEPIEIEVSERALNKVLFSFNPSQDIRVLVAKGLHAALIQQMYDHVEIEASTEFDPGMHPVAYSDAVEGSNARCDLAERAVAELEVTQMLCVKSFFAKA